jgi:hypothetical protein
MIIGALIIFALLFLDMINTLTILLCAVAPVLCIMYLFAVA